MYLSVRWAELVTVGELCFSRHKTSIGSLVHVFLLTY